jgi:hypothetical protein
MSPKPKSPLTPFSKRDVVLDIPVVKGAKMNLDCEKIPIMLLVFSDKPNEEADMKNGIGGPFLQIAVFCEKVLQEKDGVVSAIRIIDRSLITISGENVPDPTPPINIPVVLLVRVKSGDASGKHELRIKPISPSGKELATFNFPFVLGGGELAANLIMNYSLKAEESGLYWFEVILNDILITKISLNVIYQKKPEISTTSSVVQ